MWSRNFSCLLIRRQLKFLGHIVSEKGVAIQIRRSLKQWECGQPLQCIGGEEASRPVYASAYSSGAVLSQMQHREEKVVAYYSHAMSHSERQYCITRWELLAVVKSVQHFHPYLYGRHLTICTDHAALRWLLSFRNLEGQIARWLERLQQNDFEIQHRAGTKHRNADALSRCPCMLML